MDESEEYFVVITVNSSTFHEVINHLLAWLLSAE